MKTTAVMVVALLAVTGTEVAQAEQTEEQTIVVYVESGLVPMNVLRQAQLTAGKMLAGIDVTIDWRRGVTKGSSPRQERTLAVRMASETPQNYCPGAMAVSQPYEGVHITVFYDRVDRFNQLGSTLLAQTLTSRLLAHVLVHEVSHLLQGISRHSRNGVMKESWTPEDYKEMERRTLRFAPEDVHLIHLGLLVRSGGTVITEDTNAEMAAR